MLTSANLCRAHLVHLYFYHKASFPLSVKGRVYNYKSIHDLVATNLHVAYSSLVASCTSKAQHTMENYYVFVVMCGGTRYL